MGCREVRPTQEFEIPMQNAISAALSSVLKCIERDFPKANIFHDTRQVQCHVLARTVLGLGTRIVQSQHAVIPVWLWSNTII